MLSKAELFARLAEGHAQRTTVVTPNRRLAQALLAEFDGYQQARGLAVWEAADILPLGAFVERLWDDALHSERGAKLPLVLTAAQEQVLWEDILRRQTLLSVAQTAMQCREAWRLMHAWRIAPGGGGEDAAAFADWAREYEKRTAHAVDAARLPDFVAELLPSANLPRLLVAYAFDILPPQTQHFLSFFERVDCAPERAQGSAGRLVFRSAREELEQAAAWARARLEAGARRIGVVVPDLALRRREVIRVFTRVMAPAACLPGAERGALPFNVSLGAPLADYALVDHALALIELSFRELPFERASRLLRSPFLGAAEGEMARRARLDARLRESLGARVSLPKLIAVAEPCPRLRALLEKVFALRMEGERSPAVWARHFSALLDAAGFPGERPLDSAQFQTRAKWHEVLGEVAKLEHVQPEATCAEAFAALQHLCAHSLFQPETPSAPVQILGVLESAGLRFDCLWVSGLTDEAWPMDARPNPFLPIAAQRRAGVPQASAEASAALDRRLTEEWLVAAAEVLFSCPSKQDDRDLAPSPLIASLAQARLDLPAYPRHRDMLFSHRRGGSLQDGKGPAMPPGPVRGGTRVLADQAACPFRAFARWRLSAHPLDAPTPAPDAAERGKLLHALMRELWAELKSSSELRTRNLVAVIHRAAEAAVKEAGLEGRFAELERERLARLADEWLALERSRKDFEVIALEERRALEVSGLEFASRVDRIDRLAAGGHVLIDYKTGRASLRQWEAPRPDDPQLPLYAVAAREELAAVAFARLRPGDMRFIGLSRDEKLVPGLKTHPEWPALLDAWRRETEMLGAAFAAGEAAVDPKQDLKTCQRCDLQTLCRVYEKFNALDVADEEGAE